MSYPVRLFSVFLLCSPLFGGGVAFAEDRTLYKWIDREGRTHFSDLPPAGSVYGIEERSMPLLPGPPPAAVQDDYSVENQAKRLAEEREVREAARQEEARLRQEQRLRQAQLEAARAQQEAAKAQLEAIERSRPRYWIPYARPVHPRRPLPPKHDPDRGRDYTGKSRLPGIPSPYHDRRTGSPRYHHRPVRPSPHQGPRGWPEDRR